MIFQETNYFISLKTSSPWPWRLFQFRFQPRPISMKGGMFVRQGFQLIEHGHHVPRHADLIGLSVVGFGPRFLQFILEDLSPRPGGRNAPSGLLAAPMALIPINLEQVVSRLSFGGAVSGGKLSSQNSPDDQRHDVPHGRRPDGRTNQPAPIPRPSILLPQPCSASVQDELSITPAGSARRCGTRAAAGLCRQLAGMLQPERLVEQHVETFSRFRY
jgi:hypothetical protein